MINEILNRYSFGLEWGYTERSVPLTFLNYQKWIGEHKEGPLLYLADHRAELRSDIKNIFPKFQSALVFLFPYNHAAKQLENVYSDKRWNGLKIATYAFGFDGHDYHYKAGERLQEMARALESEDEELETFISLDIQPVLERDLASRAGLGFFGKSSMLINKKIGTNFIIGSIFLSKKLDLSEGEPQESRCGSCTKCIDHCPTGAIGNNLSIAAAKCVGCYTVEVFKDETPPKGYDDSDYFFGCDRCQEVCPWNQRRQNDVELKSLSSKQEMLCEFFLLRPLEEVVAELDKMSNRGHRKHFQGTSLERVGRIGMLKNIRNLRPDLF